MEHAAYKLQSFLVGMLLFYLLGFESFFWKSILLMPACTPTALASWMVLITSAG